MSFNDKDGVETNLRNRWREAKLNTLFRLHEFWWGMKIAAMQGRTVSMRGMGADGKLPSAMRRSTARRDTFGSVMSVRGPSLAAFFCAENGCFQGVKVARSVEGMARRAVGSCMRLQCGGRLMSCGPRLYQRSDPHSARTSPWSRPMMSCRLARSGAGSGSTKSS